MATYDSRGFITSLAPNGIFVFGSNDQGLHGAGAAAAALRKFGTKLSQKHHPPQILYNPLNNRFQFVKISFLSIPFSYFFASKNRYCFK